MPRMRTRSPTQHSPCWSRDRMRSLVRSEKARNMRLTRATAGTVFSIEASPRRCTKVNVPGQIRSIPGRPGPQQCPRRHRGLPCDSCISQSMSVQRMSVCAQKSARMKIRGRFECSLHRGRTESPASRKGSSSRLFHARITPDSSASTIGFSPAVPRCRHPVDELSFGRWRATRLVSCGHVFTIKSPRRRR